MVHSEGFGLENQQGEQYENGDGDHLLNHFQLNQRKGSAVAGIADPVGRYLEAILEKGNSPADQDDCK